MSTSIRPELSKNNKYWLEKHRYYELKHFCLQYMIWKKAYHSLDGLSKIPTEVISLSKNRMFGDPVVKCAESRMYYSERMNMVEKAAHDADTKLAGYILKGVTEGIAYDYLKAVTGIPCCKDTYYDLYRKFFWLLSKARC